MWFLNFSEAVYTVLKLSLKLSLYMPAFISVGFIFGSTSHVCITDVRVFSTMRASDPQKKKH